MPIMRKQKTSEYTTVDNYFVNDRKCSVECKGFLLFMLSKPDDWNFNFRNFRKELGIGDKAIRNIINKLEALKYLKREKIKSNNGYFEWIYYVYEKPYYYDLKKDNYLYSPLGHVDAGYVPEGNVLLNTNITKDKDDKENLSSFFNEEEEYNPLTINLIEQGYITENDSNKFNYDDMFNELMNSGEIYRDLLTVVNYTIQKVKKRNFLDENDKPIKSKYGYLKASIEHNLNKIKMNYEKLFDDIDDYDWLNDNDELEL